MRSLLEWNDEDLELRRAFRGFDNRYRGLGMLAAEPAPTDRNLLWNIVNFKCLRHLTKSEAPIPCDSVDVSTGWDRGVAYLKDFDGVARMLAIPTHRVTGIEDPVLLSPGERNYFASAWAGRADVESRLGKELPREAMAITVDSMASRNQDPLHLRIDCIDKDVAARSRPIPARSILSGAR
jgi:CDP-diacylglycerol pyrophosphatase